MNLNYDKLKNKIWRCYISPKEAIDHWLRIGDFYLSIGHINWLKENNHKINIDRRV